MTQTQLRQLARAREDHPAGAALGGRLPRDLRGVLAVVELLRDGRLVALRVDVDRRRTW